MARNVLLDKLKSKIKVEGRSSLYNPLLSKPKSLYPMGPGNNVDGLGGYAYIGPPADFGGSYGAYEDEQGRTFHGAKSSKMYSCFTGQPIPMKAALTDDERKALLAQMEESAEEVKCAGCRSNLMVSVAAYAGTDLYCPHCGSKLEGAMDKIQQSVSKLQEKANMKVNQDPKAAVEVKPAVAPAVAPAAPAAPVAAAAPIVTPPATPVAAEAEAEDEEAKKAKAAADAAAEEEAKKAKAAEDEKAEKEKMEASAKETAKRQRVKAMMEDWRKRSASKVAAAAAAKPAVKPSTNAVSAQLKKELRIMAALDAPKFAEMRKNPKLVKICAEVEKQMLSKELRAKARTELKVLASEDAEAAEEVKKELEFVAPEILMEEESEEGAPAAEAAPAAPAAEAAEEETEEEKAKKAAAAKAAEEEEEEEEDETAESMKHEYLASLTELPLERIEMNLYQEDSTNPFWNLTVDAEPVARIYLQDQSNHEAIRAGFLSETYAQNFGETIQKVGLEKMLKLVSAKLWAHKVDASEVSARLKEKAKIEAHKEIEGKVGTLRKDFLDCLQLAMIAADKGFYSKKDENAVALKGGLFNALIQAGLESKVATWAIEAGFEQAPVFFNSVMSHAVEIMDMSDDTKAMFKKTVMESSKLDEVQTDAPQDDNLRERLVANSLSAVAMGGNVGGENRKAAEIRTRLKFTARG